MAVPAVGNRNARTYGFLTVFGTYLLTLLILIWIFSVNRNTKVVEESSNEVNTTALQKELDSLKIMVKGFGEIASLNKQLSELELDSTKVIERPEVKTRLDIVKGTYFNNQYPASLMPYDSIIRFAYSQLELGRMERLQNQLQFEVAEEKSSGEFEKEKNDLQAEVDRLTGELNTCNQVKAIMAQQAGGAQDASNTESLVQLQNLSTNLQDCNGKLSVVEGKLGTFKGSLSEIQSMLDTKVLERKGLFKNKQDLEFIKLLNQKVSTLSAMME
ncbi:MAG: hypothetical protein AAF694_03680 [Bacteroidota bacterium]